MNRFSSNTALVTGASSGVGRAVAMALAQEGAAVSLLARRRDELEVTLSSIKREGAKALAVVADIRRPDDVNRAVAETRDALGEIDCLVNAAGVLRLGAIPSLSETDWDLLFDTNVKGAFLVSRAVLPQMQALGRGAIVNIGSVFAFAANRGSAAYAASKAALVALTKIMALDHIHEGIRINGVAPGALDTPMLTSFAKIAAPADPDSVLAASARLAPIRRLIRPEEVAALVLYLLSNEAQAIVGSIFTIDGGRLPILGSPE